MFHREAKLSQSNSFFILGARGTGKSTLIQSRLSATTTHTIDLLVAQWEERYSRNSDLLEADLLALFPRPQWVVIDEIQKVPKLLDLVHRLIENHDFRFVLTGSSARKLKRHSANLLAGRAFVFHLYPLTHRELDRSFDLHSALNWGTLPRIFALPTDEDRSEFLRAYCQTYLKEEILQEQLVRNGQSFRDFLEIAAQENGKAINYSSIGRELGVDVKTVQTFFDILEDTLLGFRLPGFHRSVRKSQKFRPKFYLFDLGVKRAMERSLNSALTPGTSAYGQAFEHFVINECARLNEYMRTDYRLSHYQTTQGAEIDLILQRSREIIAVEIKSSAQLDEVRCRKFSRIAEALKPHRKIFVSQDPVSTKIDNVECLPWQLFLRSLFVPL